MHVQFRDEHHSDKIMASKRKRTEVLRRRKLANSDILVVFCGSCILAILFTTDIYLVNAKTDRNILNETESNTVLTRPSGLNHGDIVKVPLLIKRQSNSKACDKNSGPLRKKLMFFGGAGIGSFLFGGLASSKFGPERTLLLTSRCVSSLYYSYLCEIMRYYSQALPTSTNPLPL